MYRGSRATRWMTDGTTAKPRGLSLGQTLTANEDSTLRADVPRPQLASAVGNCLPCGLLLEGASD